MGDAFMGSEALVSAKLTRHQLHSRFTTIYPAVYVARDAQVTAVTRAQAAWLWSQRQGVVAGQSAAALHGARWVDAHRPAELLWDNRRPLPGVRTLSDRFAEDEIEVINGITVTTPGTALDLACRYPLGKAPPSTRWLALLTSRLPMWKGIRNSRTAIDLVDPGAESPRETWLRLLLIRAGFPRPQTQIPVYNEYDVLIAVIDMGWEDIKVGADYEGDHHRSRSRFNRDIRKAEGLTGQGWTSASPSKTAKATSSAA